MRIGKAETSKVRVLVQDVDSKGKTKKSQSITVYEATLAEIFTVITKALNEAAKKS